MNNNHEISIDEKLEEAATVFFNLCLYNISIELRKIVNEEIGKHKNPKQTEIEWIDILEAKKVLRISSRKKWKELRDANHIDFAKVGKGFIYSRKSLENYINKNSTMRKIRKPIINN